MNTPLSEQISKWATENPITSGDKDAAISTTLINGLNILNCFQQFGTFPSSRRVSLSNSEISAQLGMNKATVSRLCKTLISQHYMRKDADGKFALAPRMLALSYPILAATPWRKRAKDLMNGLAEFAQGNISLGVFSGSETVFIMTAGTLANFPHVPETGMTTPVFETATGRALLSMLSSQELDHKLGEIKSDYPDAIAHNAPKIISGIESCKARGFCTSFGDWRKNIYGVSAPVGRAAGGLCVTLTCGVPSYRSHRRDIESDLGPRLTSVAEDLRLLDAFTT